MPRTDFLTRSSRVTRQDRITVKILAAAAVLIVGFAAGQAAATTGGPQMPSSKASTASPPSAGGVGISRPPDQAVVNAPKKKAFSLKDLARDAAWRQAVTVKLQRSR